MMQLGAITAFLLVHVPLYGIIALAAAVTFVNIDLPRLLDWSLEDDYPLVSARIIGLVSFWD